MAESDFEIRRDEMERDSLQKTIADVETALAVSTPGTRPLFENVVQNARSRVSALEKKIKDEQEALETHERDQMAIATLAQKEANLSAHEQETFSGFLKEDFFTKRDFGRLEKFYENTWDRLSEHGKDEMSRRVWGGVRHNEYTFGELPKVVREKEAKRAYQVLNQREGDLGRAGAIPEADRQDFIRAYEAGKTEEAEKVLGRDTFKTNLFRGAGSAERTHTAASLGRDAERDAAVGELASDIARAKPQRAPEGAKVGDRDLSAFALDGVKLVDTEAQGTSAEIPNARTAAAAQRDLTPGG